MLHKVTRQDITQKPCNIDIQDEKRISEGNHISLIVVFWAKTCKNTKIKDISHTLIVWFSSLKGMFKQFNVTLHSMWIVDSQDYP